MLVLAAGAPAAQGSILPVPTIPVTPPGGIFEPPADDVVPTETAPATNGPAPSEPGSAPTGSPAAAAPGTQVQGSGPAGAPATPDAESAAAVGPSGGAAAPKAPTGEAAAQAGMVTPDRATGGVPARGPNLVLAGFGAGLLAVAAAAGVVYARLRSA